MTQASADPDRAGATTASHTRGDASSPGAPPRLNGIAGVVLDAQDLAATQAFYSTLFQGVDGEWTATSRSLSYRAASQRLEFVRQRRPRTIAHAGFHFAIRVAAARFAEVTDALNRAGHTINWWREDRLAEREPTAYLSDPAGNIVQLVRAHDEGALLDHVGTPVESIEDAEAFYTRALGGEIDGYFGWTTSDVIAGRAWAAGDDPCAPWTRNAYVSFRTHRPAPSPAAQLFLRFGTSAIALFLTGERLPEPPEEQLRGTPRVIFDSPLTVAGAAERLRAVRASAVRLVYDGGQVAFEQDGHDLFLRDRSGHFLQIACSSEAAVQARTQQIA